MYTDYSPENSKETTQDDMMVSMLFNKLRDKKAITDIDIQKMCMDMEISKPEFFELIKKSMVRLTKIDGRYIVRMETMS
ncbi:MAG: hypothetical protein H7A23_25670 [Leptospiraceae bacterium]|nr:hypothetical protein [Leptospiraceae bacterium]MCP5497957.1 hypothetical protein [Leptospiraceae bacterium]